MKLYAGLVRAGDDDGMGAAEVYKAVIVGVSITYKFVAFITHQMVAFPA
jgi:hypothetical protein